MSAITPSAPSTADEVESALGYNFAVHTVDAAFFGLAIGLASWITVIPLFLASQTDSALAIGMIASIQPLGWHLPQLLTAKRVARLPRLMPMVMRMTIIERVPFFVLAALALVAGRLSASAVIGSTYLLVALIGLGGGLTATPFQSLVGKIVPMRRHGLFYGIKTASANLLLALGAVAAGRILDARPGNIGFAICFALAGLATVLSWLALSRTREPGSADGLEPRTALLASPGRIPAGPGALPPPPADAMAAPDALPRAGAILRRDTAFRRFLIARTLAQVTTMAAAYYTLFAIRRFGASGELLGWMTAVFALAQVLGNPLLGWAGDRWGHVSAMRLGLLAGSLGAGAAILAPNAGWLFVAYFLTGLANVAAFTLPLSMNLRFGSPTERPIYIGLSSTLTAPSIVLAPLLGGWLVERYGFGAAFLLALIGGLGASASLQRGMGQPPA
ncbi:MAG: MFS transporter [Caldilineae bacterium]|nr:MFS transporter [Caldilineae bacterium]